jgi:hypothetical protein
LFDDGQQIVGDRRRLRRLRVRVRRENRVAMRGGQIEQRRAQLDRRMQQRQDVLALPYPIHRHVDVVAAARGVQTTGDVLAAGGDEQAIDEEEEILTGAVVRRAADVGNRNRIERLADRSRVARGDDAAVREHDQVRVVNRHQRREEQRLRVLEVVVEDVRHVFRIEAHDREYTAVVIAVRPPWSSRSG